MPITDKTSLPQFICIPESHYKGIMQEIQAMKPKKQKKRKSYLTDKWGTRTRCKYRDGKIYNWSLLAKEWQEVEVFDCSKGIPTSRLGRMLKAGIPYERAFGIERAMNQADSD